MAIQKVTKFVGADGELFDTSEEAEASFKLQWAASNREDLINLITEGESNDKYGWADSNIDPTKIADWTIKNAQQIIETLKETM